MSIYAIVVFLHIVGALGLFIGVGLEQASLAGLRRATAAAQARDWLNLMTGLRRVDGPSGLLILLTGFYMVFARWQHAPWVGVAFAGMILMAVISMAVTRRRVATLSKSLANVNGPLSPSLRAQLADRLVRGAALVRAAIGVGIVFDMAVKPAAAGALGALAIAILVGGAAAFAGGSGRRSALPSTNRGAAA